MHTHSFRKRTVPACDELYMQSKSLPTLVEESLWYEYWTAQFQNCILAWYTVALVLDINPYLLDAKPSRTPWSSFPATRASPRFNWSTTAGLLLRYLQCDVRIGVSSSNSVSCIVSGQALGRSSFAQIILSPALADLPFWSLHYIVEAGMWFVLFCT